MDDHESVEIRNGYDLHKPFASMSAPQGYDVAIRVELRQANEILRKASAYFAQAELDRRFKP
jgi:transposase-like protein